MQRCLMVIVAISMMTMMTNAQDKEEAADATSDAAPAESQSNQIAYFLGFSVGQQMRGQGLRPDDVNVESFITGFSEALAGQEVKLSQKELLSVQQAFQKLLNARHEDLLLELKRKAEENKVKGEKWLADNSKEEGVKELSGGLQYKVLKSGKGGSPTPSDTVRVHYTGKLTNGKVFDSSVERGTPAEFMVDGVIKGWQMALQKMKVGDKWMLYIPSELAYGERGSQGAIGPNEVLVFEVELLEIL